MKIDYRIAVEVNRNNDGLIEPSILINGDKSHIIINNTDVIIMDIILHEPFPVYRGHGTKNSIPFIKIDSYNEYPDSYENLSTPDSYEIIFKHICNNNVSKWRVKAHAVGLNLLRVVLVKYD